MPAHIPPELQREPWFQDMLFWFAEVLVEGTDGRTYRGRNVLPYDINLDWVKSRMDRANVGRKWNPGAVLDRLYEAYPLDSKAPPRPIPADRVVWEIQRAQNQFFVTPAEG